jgi:hypothetical protein
MTGRCRHVAGVVVVLWWLWLLVAPVARVVADIPLRPSWQMYRGFASGLCAVSTFRHVDDHFVEVPRHEVWGVLSSSALPASARRAPDFAAAQALVRELCRRTKETLFVEVRCGSGGRW